MNIINDTLHAGTSLDLLPDGSKTDMYLEHQDIDRVTIANGNAEISISLTFYQWYSSGYHASGDYRITMVQSGTMNHFYSQDYTDLELATNHFESLKNMMCNMCIGDRTYSTKHIGVVKDNLNNTERKAGWNDDPDIPF